MSFKYPNVITIAGRVFTDKPVRKTPYQVKGVLMNLFPDEEIGPMLDGSYRHQFLYPRVQVKVLNEQIYIDGIRLRAEYNINQWISLTCHVANENTKNYFYWMHML